jgi:NDP-sugar pyrophosphorylase family protein
MPVADTSQFGMVGLDPEKNIVDFQEKPEPREAISTLANTGIYVLEPETPRSLYAAKASHGSAESFVSPRYGPHIESA